MTNVKQMKTREKETKKVVDQMDTGEEGIKRSSLMMIVQSKTMFVYGMYFLAYLSILGS